MSSDVVFITETIPDGIKQSERLEVINEIEALAEQLRLEDATGSALATRAMFEVTDRSAKKSKSVSDINFTVDIFGKNMTEVSAKVAEEEEGQVDFLSVCRADGVSIESWCPEGFDYLVNINKCVLPLIMGLAASASSEAMESARTVAQSSDTNAKEPKKKRLAHKAIKSQTVAPKKMLAADGGSSQDEHIEIVARKLSQVTVERDVEKIDYFRFVLDLSSYPKTIYNMYITSFLIHEGRAYLSFSLPSQTPFISPSHQSRDEQEIEENANRSTPSILFISEPQWAALVDHFSQDGTVLPDFPAILTESGGGE